MKRTNQEAVCIKTDSILDGFQARITTKMAKSQLLARHQVLKVVKV